MKDENERNQSGQQFTMTALQKSGYLDVKQPSNIKGRKMKSWKKKWVVLHKMSNISEGTFAAKLDLYNDELAAKNNSHDRVTHVMDKVTAIQSANSKTHKLAFDIVETFPVLSLSAHTDADTVAWIQIFQLLFWPAPLPDGKDMFQVIIDENADSKKHGLAGEYWMVLSPEEIQVKAMSKAHSMSWKLKHMKRFNVDKNDVKVLIIECGAASDYGEENFRFRSNDVTKIFQSIRKNITIAVEKRKRTVSTESSEVSRDRTSSNGSANGYKMLLVNSRDDLSNTDSENNNNIATQSPQRERKVATASPPRTPLRRQSPPKMKPLIQPRNRSKTIESSDPPSISPRSPPSRSLPGSPCSERRLKTNIHAMSSSYDELSSVERKWDEPEIVATELIHSESHDDELEISHDSNGYSHVNVNCEGHSRIVRSVSEYESNSDVNTPIQKQLSPAFQVEPDEIEDSLTAIPFIDTTPKKTVSSASEDLDSSGMENRTESVTSSDSGFGTPYTEIRRNKSDTSLGQSSPHKISHRPSNSFDSAISTTSHNSESILASVQDVIVVSEHQLLQQDRIIADMSDSKSSVYDNPIHSKTEIYCELGGVQKSKESEKEDPYAEVSKYRKDLSKFLGIDPKVNPSDVPPSLPERPNTLPVRRKDVQTVRKPTKGKGKSNKRVSFHPFKKDKEKRSSRAESISSFSSSSNSDGEEDPNLSRIQSWPFQNTEKLMQNSFYEPTDVMNASVVSSMREFPMNESHVSTNQIYEPMEFGQNQTVIGISQSGMSQSESDLLDQPFRPRNASDSALLDKVHNFSSRRASATATLEAGKAKETINIDLLTGGSSHSSKSSVNEEDILTPSLASSPPLVELLVPLDIPVPKTTHIVLESPLKASAEEKVVYRAKADGNFVWDPFPGISKSFEGPNLNWNNTSEKDFQELKKFKLEENVKSLEKIDVCQHKPDESFIDTMDPFDIFHLGLVDKTDQAIELTTDKAEGTVCQSSEDLHVYMNNTSESPKEELLVDFTEENIYMEMGTKNIVPKEDEYVCPSSLFSK